MTCSILPILLMYLSLSSATVEPPVPHGLVVQVFIYGQVNQLQSAFINVS